MTWAVFTLGGGVIAALAPPKRLPAWVLPAAIAACAVVTGVISRSVVWDAVEGLAEPLAFLLTAVPLAVLLDELGFFAAVASVVTGGRHLRLGLWVLAAAVTVLFNLDAAVVLLTPLYIRIAQRHGDAPVIVAFIPALMASLASSVLPVSNLTNLILADGLDLGVGDFLIHAAPASVVATVVGWIAYRRLLPAVPTSIPRPEPTDRDAIARGLPVVVWLLAGFTAGDRIGVPAWVIAASALAVLLMLAPGDRWRRPPWRHVPLPTALLAMSLGTLALGAAATIDLDRLVAIPGARGEIAVYGAAVAAANTLNNLPTVLVALPALREHPEHSWALLLGANVGPMLWATGALSTLLWQASMANLGYPVSNREYASVAARVGVPSLVAALLLLLAIS